MRTDRRNRRHAAFWAHFRAALIMLLVLWLAVSADTMQADWNAFWLTSSVLALIAMLVLVNWEGGIRP